MLKQRKPISQWMRDRRVAKHNYGLAWRTSIVPALTMLSGLCIGIGESGGDPIFFFSKHWVIGPMLTFCVLGLIYFAVSEIRKGRRIASEFIEQ